MARLQFLRGVRHSVGAHTDTLQPRNDSAAAAKTTTGTTSVRCPFQQQRHQRRRNQQRCQLQQPPTTAVKLKVHRVVIFAVAQRSCYCCNNFVYSQPIFIIFTPRALRS